MQGPFPRAPSLLAPHGSGQSGPPIAPRAQPTPEPSHHALASADRAFRAQLARLTLGISPATVTDTQAHWLSHLLMSPGKRIGLLGQAARNAPRLAFYAPAQSFLLIQDWWQDATTGIEGVERLAEARISFIMRQRLDAWSPSNFLWTNPELACAPLEGGGLNLLQGEQNLAEDMRRVLAGEPPVGVEKFRVGETVAMTPGKGRARRPRRAPGGRSGRPGSQRAPRRTPRRRRWARRSGASRRSVTRLGHTSCSGERHPNGHWHDW